MIGGLGALAVGRVIPSCQPRPGDAAAAPDRELVVGPGGWCWFQAPRACIDASGSLWLGSTQGTGAPQPGSVDVTRVDLATLRVLERRSLGRDRVDDHTSPSVLDAGTAIQVAWAPHRRADWIDVGTLGQPLQRISRPGALALPGRGTAYASAHLVAGGRWLLYRGEQFSWNLLTSPDGVRWTWRGLVVAPGATGQRPYLTAASDGDRLHLLVTDGNPTEYPGTSVWAAVVGADLSITDAGGRAIGRVGSAPATPHAMTQVVAGSSGGSEATDTDAWMCDLQVVAQRSTAVISVRDPWPTPAEGAPVGRWRHAFRWARQRADRTWTVEPLAWAGGELYANQPDYTGLAALDPSDRTHVVISTDVHPVTGTPAVSTTDGRVHHELWSGTRTAPGAWAWTPLTQHSIEDNLRPVLVCRGAVRVLAWLRGTYRSWTDFDTQVVVRTL